MSSRVMRLVLALAVILVVNAACPDDCSGHGDCENDACVCEEGWTGTNCGTYNCDQHAASCSSHGQCRSGSCVCHSGYGGYNCAFVTTNCNNHCHGLGSCLDGVCTCDRGYTGPDCGIVDASADMSCPNNCTGHGFCDTSTQPSTCRCMPSYWSGPACDIESSRCPAELNFCNGHGICAPTDPLEETSAWVCTCQTGFCGASCNEACPSCPNNCTGKGTCRGSTCDCATGYGGDDCSLVAPISTCPSNCSGHGICTNSGSGYSCECNAGYRGSACSIPAVMNPSGCNGNGEVLSNGGCACYPGYGGADCESELLSCALVNNCTANGICRNGSCACNPGFAGANCSVACPSGLRDVGCNADRHHGRCQADGTCLCREGEWTGAACELRAHKNDYEDIVSESNPLGIVVLAILLCAVVVMIGGFAYNYFSKGKRGLNAVPGMDAMRSKVKGDDYETAPGDRYDSNY